MNTPLLFASTNRGKIEEVKDILIPQGIQVISPDELIETKRSVRLQQPPEVEESGDTYLENAKLKAEALHHWSALDTVADDTGLEVYALDGRPGVRSARYAGVGASAEENKKKLLTEMEGVSDRRARFVCALYLISSNAPPRQVFESLEGVIAEEGSGKGGFGYDSIFFLPDLKMTLAEAKGRGAVVVTHREKAFRSLLRF